LPQLSVVIIGRNEGERLMRCIHSVHQIPLEDIEIIYVDSDSQDDSPKQAQALGAQVIVVHPQRPAAAIGRNAGWQVAQAPYVLFLDGDTILQPQFVPAALAILAKQPQVAVVWGHRRELYPHVSWYQRVMDLDWIYPAGQFEFCGGDALMRREALEAVGGYNPQLIAGEEPEMCQRLRAQDYVILHIDEPMTLHDLAITRWTQYWRRAVRAGHAYAEVSQLLKQTATPLWQRESRKNLLHAGFLIGLIVLGIVSALLLPAWWPLLSVLGILLLLFLYSSWRSHWKSNQWFSLLLYGFHSHLQQIPIAIGQLSYYYNRLRKQRVRLIEYK